MKHGCVAAPYGQATATTDGGGIAAGAPTSWMSSSTAGLGPRCPVSQDMSPPGPVMKPSTDIVAEYSSLLMIRLQVGSDRAGPWWVG